MMRLDISLEDEKRKIIEALDDVLLIEDSISLNDFKLLRYLDPYGDTIFNYNQIDDLIADLERLDMLATSAIIKQIIALAERCKEKVHTYLYFNGD
jgi:hypothetical protein